MADKRRKTNILAARKHASVLRRFAPKGARHAQFAHIARSRLRRELGIKESELRAAALCQSDSLGAIRLSALFPMNDFPSATAAQAGKSLRFASLKMDMPLDLQRTAPKAPVKRRAPAKPPERGVLGWVNSANLAHTSMLATPVKIREMKA